jgi:hypothetical protein
MIKHKEFRKKARHELVTVKELIEFVDRRSDNEPKWNRRFLKKNGGKANFPINSSANKK